MTMYVVVGYESMYGNTHRVANAIAAGFSVDDEVVVTPIAQVDISARMPDVLVVGVPTHAHGLPRPSSRRTALDSASSRYARHQIDPSAAVDTGAREWLATLPARVPCLVAVYDTRFRPPGWLVGHPARRLARLLVGRGARLLTRPESFFVDKHEDLRGNELERARVWGMQLRRQAAVTIGSVVSGR
jgi:hypothetical protein